MNRGFGIACLLVFGAVLAGCEVTLRDDVPPPPHEKIKIKSFDVVPPHGGWGSCYKCHEIEREDEDHERKQYREHQED